MAALGWMWARMARVALDKLAAGADGEADFYEAKLSTARFYMARVLPECSSLAATVAAGPKSLMDHDEAAF